jgi:hypothetical protein
MEQRIAVIDCDGIVYACCFGIKLLDQNNDPIKIDNKFTYRDKTEEEVYLAIDSIMYDILDKTKATCYLGFIKGNNTIKARLQINPSYKANRVAEIPFHYNTAKQYLIDTWKCIEAHDCEVDDICRIVSTNTENSFIVAVDKDLLNLEGVAYNWRKQEWVETSKEEAHLFFWKSMCCGDQADGICGLKGRGEKFFEKLYQSSLDHEIPIPIETLVFYQYIKDLGEEVGIEEFYKNYKSLKILDFKEGFTLPYPIEFKPIEEVPQIEEDLPEFDF